MNFIKTPRQLIESLVDTAMWNRILKCKRENQPYPRNGRIGSDTLNLTKEDATLLQELKSDDIKNIRWTKC